MASSKVMKSSASRNSDLSRRSSSTKPQQQVPDHNNNNKNEACSGLITSSPMTVDGILRNVYNAATTTPSSAADSQIGLIDTAANNASLLPSTSKTVDDVWREIVSGDLSHKKEMKEEAPDEMMTLEDFLVKAGAVDDDVVDMDDADVKAGPIALTDDRVYVFDPPPPPPPPPQVDGGGVASIIAFGNGVDHRASGGRGKRGRVMLEPLDKAAQQRQRRMIKNRESAARSRERKQAYQVELESLAVRLEEENELLIKEKAERTKERYKQLMEKVIPVVEKPRPPRVIRRVNSMLW